MKKMISKVIMCLCLLPNICYAQENSAFNEIKNGYVCKESWVEPCKTDSISVPFKNQQDNYSYLSVQQLESFINKFESYIDYKRNKTSNHNLQCKAYKFYSGNDHELNISNLIDVMEEIGLSNKLFVLAQAIVETGHFNSHVCKEYHNLFGLRNPRTHSYFRFSRWEDSVIGYQKFIQYKYKGGNYLSFLKRIGYAEDPGYVRYIAKVAKQLHEQLRAEGRLS